MQLQLCSREAAVAENTGGIAVVDQDMGGGDAITLALAGLLLHVNIQHR